MSMLDDLIPTESSTFEEILNTLLKGDKDLDLKTHIHNPKNLAILKSIADYLKNELKDIDEKQEIANIIYNFLETFLRYMISFDRLSRKEIIKAIASSEKELGDDNFTKKIINEVK